MRGVCGDDAQPYACATQRFARDVLLPQSRASSVPSCRGCPPNTTLPYDHCKSHADAVELDVLEARARGLRECEATHPPGSREPAWTCVARVTFPFFKHERFVAMNK